MGTFASVAAELAGPSVETPGTRPKVEQRRREGRRPAGGGRPRRCLFRPDADAQEPCSLPAADFRRPERTVTGLRVHVLVYSKQHFSSPYAGPTPGFQPSCFVSGCRCLKHPATFRPYWGPWAPAAGAASGAVFP